MVVFRRLTAKDREIVKARQIISNYARAEGLDLGLLRIHCRRQDLVEIRREAAAEVYRRCAVSVSEIGRILDRNHSTIATGLRALGLMV